MTAFQSQQLRQLDSLFAASKKVAIVVHSHPDGDALGSSLALAHYLSSERGADPVVILPDAWPDTLAFLPGFDFVLVAEECPQKAVSVLESAELLVCLDLNAFDRTATLADVLPGLSCSKLLIDHHQEPDRASFDLVFSQTEISSSCELLYQLLVNIAPGHCAACLPSESLYCLLTGMTTDTNNFANSVYPSTFKMASDIIASGVDREEILYHLYRQYRENRYRALGYVCSELMTITPDGVAYVVLDKENYERFGLKEGETEGFVNIPLEIANVNMSLFLREDQGYFRVSIRSKRGYSARALAKRYFNGGGHECASGGKLYFPGDIAARGDAAAYIETVTARFLHGDTPSE